MTAPLYSLVSQPDLDSPVLILALKGWIDAGLGAEQAASVLASELELRTVARFDPDALLDWRARRPVMHISDGVNTNMSWEETELRWARDQSGNDVILLVGNEPDHAWLAFSDQVVDLAHDLGTRLVIGLGAYPAPVPHTRAVQVAAAASSPELTEGLVRSDVEAPSGVQSLIERRAALRGLPSVGLWAQVPHYVAAMPYPAASLVLLETINRLGGLDLPTADLGERAQASRSRIDQLIGENPEHLAMLHQLEQQADEQDTTTRMAATSGDELAAELERFLRDQG
jgi:proteasome assembly chaperone (PAC2) family protein